MIVNFETRISYNFCITSFYKKRT